MGKNKKDRGNAPGSPLFEDHDCREDNEDKPDDIVPLDLLPQIEHGKATEDNEGDDLLDRLQLRSGELAVSVTIRWDLEAVFDKGDTPAEQDDRKKGRAFIFQMTVPGKGHEDVRGYEEYDRFQSISQPWAVYNIPVLRSSLKRSDLNIEQLPCY